MPLIILTGYPCSGLSYRASQLRALLHTIQSATIPDPDSKARYKIHVVHSHDEAHPRTVYDNARSEKQARAVVYARVKRLLGRDSIVIVDGMNYIKGLRYQLWCEAKAAGTTCCVVHVGTPVDQCTANNEERIKQKEKRRLEQEEQGDKGENAKEKTESETTEQTTPTDLTPENASESQPEHVETADNPSEPYPPELLQNLIFRYEEPSTASRWDKPLFTVPWSDPQPPAEDIWTAITGIPVPKTNTPTPSLSTFLSPTASNNITDNGHNGRTQETPVAPPSTSTEGPAITTSSTTNTTVTATGRTRLSRPKIVPHQATMAPQTTNPNSLYTLEKRTAEIIAAIRAFTLENPTVPASIDTITGSSPQQPRHVDDGNDNDDDDSSGGNCETKRRGDGLTIPIEGVKTPVFVPLATLAAAPTEELAGAGGVLALPRLQRLRRQWVGLNRAVVGGGHGRATGMVGMDQIGEAFVRFLNAEFEGVGVDVS
ncbi:hypothetical protein VTO42DRAFT_7211 [Malbranchea cinnamomea]